jgi:hypothetical protein
MVTVTFPDRDTEKRAVDEYEDRAELHDPAVKAAIAESRRQFEAGKRRPIEEFFAELEKELVGA